MSELFTIELHAKVDGEWHKISEINESGAQNVGRMRRVADNAVVPCKLVERHD